MDQAELRLGEWRPLDPLYYRAEFLSSAAKLSQAPPDRGLEVAFSGRSNAGKSSVINILCRKKGLAKIGKTPGRTQLLNFFRLDEHRRLVDLPGYGYAKVPEKIRGRWQREMTLYLEKRRSLSGIMLVMDCRQPLTSQDEQMLEWGQAVGLRMHIVLTKADKLSRGNAANTLMQVRARLSEYYPEVSVQLFSALKSQGVEEAHRILDLWLQIAPSSGPLPTLDPAAS